MSDTELLALTALVNSQAADLAYRTAKAQSMNEEPASGDFKLEVIEEGTGAGL